MNKNDSEHRKLLKEKLKNKINNSRNNNNKNTHKRPDICSTLLEHGIDDANLLQLAKNLNIEKMRNAIGDMKQNARANASETNDEEEALPPES